MSFFARFFAPKVFELETRLDAERREKEFWQQRFSESANHVETLTQRIFDETRRNRRREDDLQNVIIRTAAPNAALPAPRDVETKSDAEAGELTEDEKKMLWERAADYAEQTVGENATHDDISKVYQMMLADPNRWLTDN